MNSKDIKPWRERLAIIPVVPTVSRSVARFKCIFDEISDLRQALVAAEAVIRGIARAKRFDKDAFADADAFVDWAQSLCRHALEKP